VHAAHVQNDCPVSALFQRPFEHSPRVPMGQPWHSQRNWCASVQHLDRNRNGHRRRAPCGMCWLRLGISPDTRESGFVEFLLPLIRPSLRFRPFGEVV
jgi:hypothetical protein